MPATLRKNLNLCFTKCKPPLTDHRPHPPSPPCSLPSTATTLFRNFNSLYDQAFDPSSCASTSSSTVSSADPFPDPDFAAAFASKRFFFSSPGLSNSIIDSCPHTTAPPPETCANAPPLVDDSVAVPTFSPDPYADFRRSMQEMVDARHLFDVKSDWDFLHELLLCYLALNPKSTHKFIVGAFSDLLVSLMSQQPPHPRRRQPKRS